MSNHIKRQADDTFMSIGSYLKRKISIEGQSIIEFAQDIGVHPQTIYNVTRADEPRSISAKLALKLSNHFVEGVEFWLSDGVNLSANGQNPLEGAPTDNVIPMSIGSGRNRTQEGGSNTGPASFSSGVLVDSDIQNLLESRHGAVKIRPYNRDQIQPATFDLTIGLIMPRDWRKISRAKWTFLQDWCFSEKQDVALNNKARKILDTALESNNAWRQDSDILQDKHTLIRNESVFILAREHVNFGKKYYARVGAIAENVMKGIQVSHGLQVDPGFSGAFFVVFTNLFEDTVRLHTGDKLVSLEIHKLPRAPHETHKSDAEAKCAEIAIKLTNNLQSLFDYTEVGGKTKASSKFFDETPIGTEDTVKGDVLNLILDALNKPTEKLRGNLRFLQEIELAAENILIQRSDAKALGVSFDVVRESNNSLAFFRGEDDVQTLKDTIKRLELDLLSAIVHLVQGNDD